MRFNEWLRLDELTSMSQIDSSGVELTKHGRGYIAAFDDILVFLVPKPGKKVGSKMVDGIWSVEFQRGLGGGRYKLTGSSGSSGTAVYGKVLARVKKLTEIEEVNGLEFTGAEARQDIMYDKFLKTLGGFTPIGGGIYLKDEVVKANASEEDLEHYKGVGEKREIRLHNLKVVKAALRNKGLIGKITGYFNSDSGKVLPAIIVGIDSSLVIKLLSWDGEKISDSPSDFNAIVSPSLIDPSLMSSLMGEIQQTDPDKEDMNGIHSMLRWRKLRVDGSTYDFGFKKETA